LIFICQAISPKNNHRQNANSGIRFLTVYE